MGSLGKARNEQKYVREKFSPTVCHHESCFNWHCWGTHGDILDIVHCMILCIKFSGIPLRKALVSALKGETKTSADREPQTHRPVEGRHSGGGTPCRTRRTGPWDRGPLLPCCSPAKETIHHLFHGDSKHSKKIPDLKTILNENSEKVSKVANRRPTGRPLVLRTKEKIRPRINRLKLINGLQTSFVCVREGRKVGFLWPWTLGAHSGGGGGADRTEGAGVPHGLDGLLGGQPRHHPAPGRPTKGAKARHPPRSAHKFTIEQIWMRHGRVPWLNSGLGNDSLSPISRLHLTAPVCSQRDSGRMVHDKTIQAARDLWLGQRHLLGGESTKSRTKGSPFSDVDDCQLPTNQCELTLLEQDSKFWNSIHI